ncbi:MAG: hypothetical protein RQ751_11070 [Longimicrobiales bacterium]|nr:hypothetical protein [Longimicrobiales bacterium]
MLRTPRTASFLPALAVALLMGGCAAGGSGGGSESGFNVITREDLAELHRLNAYQAVRRLRPQWLEARGLDSFYSTNEVVVYQDGTRMGGVNFLRSLRVNDVATLRFLDSRAATTRYGGGHPSGAIMVTTRGGAGDGP